MIINGDPLGALFIEIIMNDFTKEELQLILKGMSQYYLDNNSIILMDKIQSMIDSYCDHTWTDGSGNTITCFKCHAMAGKR